MTDAFRVGGAHDVEGGVDDAAGDDGDGQPGSQVDESPLGVCGPSRREGVTFVVENLDLEVDHPNTPFARAADVLALVRAVDSPHLRMMFDVYHAQIGEGNLIELLRRAGDHIGEVQVADVPGRCEPGTGEINYPAVARTLAAMGYTGTVGLEGWASGDPVLALQRFRTAFTLPALEAP